MFVCDAKQVSCFVNSIQYAQIHIRLADFRLLCLTLCSPSANSFVALNASCGCTTIATYIYGHALFCVNEQYRGCTWAPNFCYPVSPKPMVTAPYIFIDATNYYSSLNYCRLWYDTSDYMYLSMETVRIQWLLQVHLFC